MRIRSFGTKGLFGIFDHHVELNNKEKLTLIHGPNGFGKTTLLRLLRDFFEGTFTEIGKTPLTSFYIDFDDGRAIVVTKDIPKNEETRDSQCLVTMKAHDVVVVTQVVSTTDYEQHIADELAKRAPYMRHIGPDVWEDSRDGELLDTDELAVRFGIRELARREKQALPVWLKEIVGSVSVRLIETQRLILERLPRRFSPPTQPRSTATVMEYSHQLANKIQQQFNEYARVSAQLDRTFIVRLLKLDFGLHEALPGSSITAKVENLNEKRRRLMESGLLNRDDEAIPSPEAPDPAIDRILNAYLQDVESKLAVFDSLLEKIEILKSIVDAHVEPYKKMEISPQSGFQFRTNYGKQTLIQPSNLSSGEQHILILFYDLLFNASENSLILIDEPEISLHVDWQISFLSDLQKIVAIVPHDIILATHSPQIVNNRWDLTVPLNGTEGTEI